MRLDVAASLLLKIPQVSRLPLWQLTFLYVGSSYLFLICSKCINCFCSDSSQCQLMLAFSKSSCCPICPHVASVAHSVVQELFEGAFCSVWDNQLPVSILLILVCGGVSQQKKQGNFSSQPEQWHFPFLYTSGQEFHQQLLTLLTCVGANREHFCLAAFTSACQSLLARLQRLSSRKALYGRLSGSVD